MTPIPLPEIVEWLMLIEGSFVFFFDLHTLFQSLAIFWSSPLYEIFGELKYAQLQFNIHLPTFIPLDQPVTLNIRQPSKPPVLQWDQYWISQ